MHKAITQEDFAKCVNQTCQVHHGTSTLEMRLVECRKLDRSTHGGVYREPFALLFRGPKSPVLPQQTYQFDFGSLGSMEIFIVPIGADDAGMQYEANFA